MKYLILNIPYKQKIIRKYSCSYFANGFLYPPYELLRVATIIKQRKSENDELLLLDAIAENLSDAKCIKQIIDFSPDVIITLISVDFSNSEIKFISKLKKNYESKLIAIGYLPYLFPQNFPQFDVILGADFENNISNASLLSSPIDFVNSLSVNHEVSVFDADIVEYCDYSLLKPQLYREFLAKGKTAFTYFSFGCPYKCTYCIRTYNLNAAFFRNSKNIFEELSYFANQGYDNIRILDDNCTLSKSVLRGIKDFCELKNMKFNFYGLTRIDLIDDEIIELLKDLNFKRVFIGIESFDNDRIKEYQKGKYVELDEIRKKVSLLINSGIEVGVFLLFNPLNENWKSVRIALKKLRTLPFQYAGISYLIPYPGTKFFDSNIDKIEMGFSPDYSVKFKGKSSSLNIFTQYYFIISFYVFNRKTIMRTLILFLGYPKQIISIAASLLSYIFKNKKERKDFL